VVGKRKRGKARTRNDVVDRDLRKRKIDARKMFTEKKPSNKSNPRGLKTNMKLTGTKI